MNYRFGKYLAIILLLVVIQADTVPEALAGSVAFSFDSVWFYRDGTRVVPEISKRWITVVFDQRFSSSANEFEPATDSRNSVIRKKARTILNSHGPLTEYLYDPNLAENACFFKMRAGMKLRDISRIINQVSQDRAVRYVHPAVILDNKTFAFFNDFEMEWKTGISKAQRESLLRATHSTPDENDEKEKRYTVNIAAIPFFRALNLLAEDIRVLRVTPHLVEIKPSISTKLSLFMNGGNIGDGIPFSFTINFSNRISIDPSSIATLNLRPPELQKELFDCVFDPYDYTRAVTKSPIVITGRVMFYAPGEYTIPSVKIGYSCPSCADKTVRSIESEPVLFMVSSIIPNDRSEYRLIVPADPVTPDFRPGAQRQQALQYLWLAIGCFSGLALCVAWGFSLRRKNTGEWDRLEERRKEAQLVELLRALLHAPPSVPHWSYLGETGAHLREYLVLRYGIEPKYRGGSGRQFMETVNGRIPPELFGPLSEIFTAVDTCVALELEQYQDMEQLRSDILKIVDAIARNGKAQR